MKQQDIEKMRIKNDGSDIDDGSSVASESDVGDVAALNKTVQLSYKQCLWIITKRAAPTAGAYLVAAGGQMAVAYMLGEESMESLAALSLIAAASNILITPLSNIMNATGVLTGEALGEQRFDEIGQIFRQSLLLTTGLSVVTVPVLFFSQPILALLKQPQNISALTQSYFRKYIICLPAIYGIRSEMQTAVGASHARLFLLANLAQALLSAGFSYCFIFGKLGFPKKGLDGSAYALVCANWATFLGCTAYLGLNKNFSSYQLMKRDFSQTWHYLKKSLYLGIPMCFQAFFEEAGLTTATIMIGWLGENDLDAQEIVALYVLPLTLISLAIGNINGICVGEMVGEKNFHNARRIGWSGTGLNIAVIALLSAPLFIAPQLLAMPFLQGSEGSSEKQNIISIANELFRVQGAFTILDALENSAGGALVGLSDTKTAMLLGLLSSVIFVGLGYVFEMPIEMGITGVFLGRLAGIVIHATGITTRWGLKSQHAIVNDGLEDPVTSSSQPACGFFNSCHGLLNSCSSFFRGFQSHNAERDPLLPLASSSSAKIIN